MAGPQIQTKITVDADQYEKKMKQLASDTEETGSKLGGTFKGIGQAAAGFLAVQGAGALLGFGNEMFNLGTQIDVMDKKANTVFGASAQSVKDWADQNNESMGMSKQAVAGLAADMGDLLKPMGFTEDAAASMSEQMVGLSGALSAWSGGKMDAAQVSDTITKAMLGETDGLKSLGISISAAEVDAKLLANGQKDLTGTALAQAKATATQQLIMEKSADAQKAWSDGTMDGVKAQNDLKAQVEQVKASIAQGLQPVFAGLVGFLSETAIPAIKSLTGFLSEHKEVLLAAGILIGAALVPAFIAWATAAATAAVATIAATWPVIAIAAALGALVAGVIWAYQNFEIFRDVIDTFGDAVQWVFGWVSSHWQLLVGILTGPIGIAVMQIMAHWDTIKNTFQGVVNFIGGSVNSVVGFFQSIPGRVGGIWNGMFDGIREAFRSAINWVIGAWNGLRFTTPSFDAFGIHVGGQSIGVPRIPYLAQGGIVKGSTGGTLAMIGEGGPGHDEAVVPLSRGGRGLGATYIVNVNVAPGANLRAAGREMTRALREYERAT